MDGIDGAAGVGVGRIPGDELPRLDEATLAAAAGAHRLPGDDSEHVFASRLNRIVRRRACH